MDDLEGKARCVSKHILPSFFISFLTHQTGNHLFSNKDNNPQKKKYYHYCVDYILVFHLIMNVMD